ncbi:MAG: pyrroline-5-carboxylate reductase [Burkholderiales bacterium]
MTPSFSSLLPMAFIGGGNMAQALLSGWLKQGLPAAQIHVVEPLAETRQRLQQTLGAHGHETPDSLPSDIQWLVWAIKPQVFKQVASPLAGRFEHALHLSVAAGVRSDSMARWLQSERIVRAMPNTPALVGLGQTGLFARAAVLAPEREQVGQLMQAIGQTVWVAQEALLDAVTAVSGSGPAYVFYFIEAMVSAGVRMGLSNEQAHQLAVGTFVGAAEMARSSAEPLAVLRDKVTSKGGTTYAAINRMQADGLAHLIDAALQAAQQRSVELGDNLDTPTD